MPVDSERAPIPWITYPALRFLEARVAPDFTVFEWGSGNSTRWWARRVGRLTSIEHDHEWFQHLSGLVRSQGGTSVDYRYIPRGARYVKSIAEHSDLDIIVIDGRDRVECSRFVVDALSDRGVVIWDDTERARYEPGLDALAAKGFRRIDFVGLRPSATLETKTTILYRPANCLGI